MVSASVAQAIARRYGSSVDEVMAVFDDVDDAEAASRFLQGESAAERLGHTATATFFDQPARIADTTLSTGQKTVLGLGGAGAGAYGVHEWSEQEQAKYAANQADTQEAALQEILSAPNLSDAQRQELLDELMQGGLFSTPGQGDDGGGDGLINRVVGTLLGDIGIIEFFILFMLLYFGGKALVEASKSRGSTGGS